MKLKKYFHWSLANYSVLADDFVLGGFIDQAIVSEMCPYGASALSLPPQEGPSLTQAMHRAVSERFAFKFNDNREFHSSSPLLSLQDATQALNQWVTNKNPSLTNN